MKIQFVASLETKNPGVRDSKLGEAELIIFFDDTYGPNSNTCKSLEISSSENAPEYWEGVHRVGQDRL